MTWESVPPIQYPGPLGAKSCTCRESFTNVQTWKPYLRPEEHNYLFRVTYSEIPVYFR